MIGLWLTTEDFEQDIRPLVTSFFPKEGLMVGYGVPEVNSLFSENRELTDLLFCQWREEGLELRCFQRERDGSEEEAVSVRFTDRKLFRDEAKRAVYRLLHRVTGRTLPWGTLTGVRPVKPVLTRLMNNESEEQIREFLTKEYFCSKEKQDLSLQVAKKEKSLLAKLQYQNSYSLYVGIPFCPSICLYCSFSSYPLSRYGKDTGAYVEALKRELSEGAGALQKKRLATIYFGGGTPTALSAEELREIIHSVKQNFRTEEACEWTVEAGRPDTITKEKLLMLKEEGISRISINPQTMNQKTLDVIGRRHTTEQIREAFFMAREIGFTNINMDLILGLTGENAADVRETLRQIAELSPDSVTVHTLALKRAARLNQEKEQYKDKSAVEVKEMLAASVAFAKEENYLPYYLYRQKNMEENLENVGYAREGKEGLYNILIMEEKHSILAFGAGGTTKLVLSSGDRMEREENVKSLKDYLERTDEMIQRKREFLEKYQPYL